VRTLAQGLAHFPEGPEAIELMDVSSWMPKALDAAPEAMMAIDAEWRIVVANPKLQRLFNRSKAELLGTSLDLLFAKECRLALHEELAAFFAAPEKRELRPSSNVSGIDAAGRNFPAQVSVGKAGVGATHAVFVVRDVSGERETVERLLEASRKALDERDRIASMLDFAPAFILAVSRGGVIEFINRTLPQYTKQETIGRSWLTYFEPDRHAQMEAMLRSVFEKGSTEFYELNTPGPDGAPIWFESHMGPMRIGGETVAAVLVSQDVTERKRAQTELMAGRHLALLGTLAAGVAHEINTPIQFVGDSIRFLRDSTESLLALLDQLQALRRAAVEGASIGEISSAATEAEEAADLPYIRENLPKAFETSVEGLNQVATIVRSLKDFAHPSAADMAPTDINRAVQTSMTIARSEYKYVADVTLELGEVPPVMCYANDIAQAVLNITVNAAHAISDVVKGTSRRGNITVRTWREGDYAVISVKDTGGGIPEAIQHRVFDPFFTTKEIGKGTGQGLAIAWSAVKDRHGGRLTFETKVGEGTTFFIRLPIAGAQPPRRSVG
jgi:PAS domain S-box-containing protein